MTVANLFLVRRVVAPVQELTARAREIDPTRPGMRFAGADAKSEAGELALAFNEMLERLEQERALSARSVLAAHESERLRVAQELHDEVGQTLTAVLLQLSRAQGRLGERGVELVDAQEAVRASLEDVRRIASELRPETLADLGLASALTTLGDSFGRRTGIDVRRRIDSDLPAVERGDRTRRLPDRAGGAHERRPPFGLRPRRSRPRRRRRAPRARASATTAAGSRPPPAASTARACAACANAPLPWAAGSSSARP